MEDTQLIFLISQPRSGSSMLQQLMIESPQIKSTPEPWFMLSLIYTYKTTKLAGEYNPNYSQINFAQYLNQFDKGLQRYQGHIQKTALDLYSWFLKKNSSAFFLDKTPRYYHIIKELIELFPNAKFIFLSRNPIAVFSSILHYNFNGKVASMFSNDRYHDLYTAINLISDFKKKNNPNTYFINYENILLNSKTELENLFDFLKITYPEDIGTYRVNSLFSTTQSVDKKSLKKHNKPVKNYINAWVDDVDSYQKKIIYIEYLKSLNSENLKVLGYNKKEIINEIAKIKHKRTLFNFHLSDYIKNTHSFKFKIKKKIRNSLYAKQNNT